MPRLWIRVLKRVVLASVVIGWILALSIPAEWPEIVFVLARRPFRLMTGGRAPYSDCQKLVAWEHSDCWYGIDLAPGHTLEEHKRVVNQGADLENAITKVHHIHNSILGSVITCDAETEDDMLIEAIRADPGVLMVECDVPYGRLRLINPYSWNFVAHEKRIGGNWKAVPLEAGEIWPTNISIGSLSG